MKELFIFDEKKTYKPPHLSVGKFAKAKKKANKNFNKKVKIKNQYEEAFQKALINKEQWALDIERYNKLHPKEDGFKHRLPGCYGMKG